MNKLSVAGVVVVLAAGGAAVFLQHQDNRALRREVGLLRTEVQMATRTMDRVATSRVQDAGPTAGTGVVMPSGDSGELVKLREEMAALRKSTQGLTELVQTAQAAAKLKSMSTPESSVATKLIPATEWKNAGKGSPEAAAETALWAALGGDVETLANTLVFTPTAKAKGDAWFASLPESTRQQYGSAEKVMALLIARESGALTGMQVLGQKDIGADDVGLRIRFTSDGKTKDDTFLMHRNPDGWRLLLPDQTVENLAKKLAGKR